MLGFKVSLWVLSSLAFTSGITETTALQPDCKQEREIQAPCASLISIFSINSFHDNKEIWNLKCVITHASIMDAHTYSLFCLALGDSTYTDNYCMWFLCTSCMKMRLHVRYLSDASDVVSNSLLSG